VCSGRTCSDVLEAEQLYKTNDMNTHTASLRGAMVDELIMRPLYALGDVIFGIEYLQLS
jgi:hypothetical protein